VPRDGKLAPEESLEDEKGGLDQGNRLAMKFNVSVSRLSVHATAYSTTKR
jgi:hypothetical protein